MSISTARIDESPVWPNAGDSLQFRRRNFNAPALSAGSAVPERTAPPVDGDTAPPDRHLAQALLAQQCRSRIDGLPPRQREVLAELVAGRSNKQAAHALGISPRTIEVYRASMMNRLKVRTLAQALYIAFMAGFAPPDTISHEG